MRTPTRFEWDRMKKPYLVLLPLVFIFSGFLSACSSAQTPPESKPAVAVPITAASEPEEALNEVNTLSPEGESVEEKTEEVLINYNPKGRRDPFRSIVISRSAANLQRNVDSLPPLQRRDLSDLKLIGIIWGEMGPSAIVTVPGGSGYTVRVGTRIGLNNGVIKRITQNEVVVEESLLSIFGETSQNDVIMELHPHKEGQE